MNDVTRILNRIQQGGNTDELFPLVYDELRKLAAAKLAQESPGNTLEPTALVHEAYLRLVNSDEPGWEGRGHFFSAAAESMRRILIDRARGKKSLKRGGDRTRLDIQQIDLAHKVPSEDLLIVDEALEKLNEEDPKKAELVKLRFFAGLSVEQAGGVIGVSRATADRYWNYSKAWLFDAIRDQESHSKTS